MTESISKKLIESGFKEIGGNFVGKVEDFFYEIYPAEEAENQAVILIKFAENENKGKFFEFLGSLQQEAKIVSYNIENNRISVVFEDSLENNICDVLKSITEKTKEFELISNCDSCDSTEEISYCTSNGVYMRLCKKCAESVLAKYDAEKNSKNHYFMGFLGSLIGGLVGSVLWIVLGAVGFYASIAGVAIAFCAFKGYEMMKGKLTVTGIVLNVIAIVIAFLFAMYAGLFLDFKKEVSDGTLINFFILTPYLFTDADFIKAILPDFFLGLLFAVLGTYRSITNQFKMAKKLEAFKIEKIEL